MNDQTQVPEKKQTTLGLYMTAQEAYETWHADPELVSIIDGMEGDMVNELGSPDHGRRLKNGWNNSGSPWTYDINQDVVMDRLRVIWLKRRFIEYEQY